jgi:hypothetical protein
MSESYFVTALNEAKKRAKKEIGFNKKLNSIPEYLKLSESQLYLLDEGMIRPLLYLLKSNDDMVELFIYSMNNLPDEIHYGFYNLFSGQFSEKNFKLLIDRINEFLDEKKVEDRKSATIAFCDLKGVRAAMLIKAMEAYFLVESNNYEEALALFLKCTEMTDIEELDFTGIISLLYLLLKKYDELISLHDEYEYENAYLEYVFAFYLFKQSKTKNDVSDASIALGEAIIGNPIVIELFRTLNDENILEEKFNLNSLYEAEMILTGLSCLIKDKKTADWFANCAASTLTQITNDPELQKLVQHHYDTEDECDDDCCSCGEDHCCDHDDDDSEDDGKIIKLYDK